MATHYAVREQRMNSGARQSQPRKRAALPCKDSRTERASRRAHGRCWPPVVRITILASVIAVFGLVFLLSGSTQAQGGATASAVKELNAPAQKAVGSVSALPAKSHAFWKQVSSTLEHLPLDDPNEVSARGKSDVQVYKKAAPATVFVETDRSFGSGVVISPRGEVLTNFHVIVGARQIVVVFKPEGRNLDVAGQQAYVATPVKVDKVADLALLQVQNPPAHLTVLLLGDMESVEVGQDVHAIGHPEGEIWTYTTGIISQIRPGYEWKTGSDAHRSTVIQTQTAINPGNSGGPLLNDEAEIIGINSFIRQKAQGINYAVAVDSIKSFLQRARSRETAPAPRQRAGTRRTEVYGANIIGVYTQTRTPPPDVWLVMGDDEEVLYSLVGQADRRTIDTVIQGRDPEWHSVVYYVDANCDGMIDMIALDVDGDEQVDRYSRPSRLERLVSRAPEFVKALEQGLIPYANLRFCS